MVQNEQVARRKKNCQTNKENQMQKSRSNLHQECANEREQRTSTVHKEQQDAMSNKMLTRALPAKYCSFSCFERFWYSAQRSLCCDTRWLRYLCGKKGSVKSFTLPVLWRLRPLWPIVTFSRPSCTQNRHVAVALPLESLEVTSTAYSRA